VFYSSLAICDLQTVTIYFQPALPTSTPSALAVVEYDSEAGPRDPPALKSFTPPIIESTGPLAPIKIGLIETDKSLFASSSLKSRTTTTTYSAFARPGDGVLRVFLSTDGTSIESVSFSLQSQSQYVALKEMQDRKKEPRVEIVKSSTPPKPVLNKPVTLSPEGKMKEEVPEKSLLQKYWWLGAALLFLVLMGGGGGEK